jgi:predicted Zn-dependent protease with MMP-like domain/DNA-directed RNA polymerase subunit M/transcription elongation factor TFIIS
MAETTNSDAFDEIVEWAYSTLPQEIRELPDFPGIQVLDEPPENMLKRKKRRPLGLFSGIPRTQQRHDDIRVAPNLIFICRGPIRRCSRGDLRAEVKEVVWHEVAHWLGYSEGEVEELGLATLSLPVGYGTPRKLGNKVNHFDADNAKANERMIPEGSQESSGAEEQTLHCVKCYSAEITFSERDKLVTYSGAWLNAVHVRAKICTCKSCGYQWEDEDDM